MIGKKGGGDEEFELIIKWTQGSLAERFRLVFGSAGKIHLHISGNFATQTFFSGVRGVGGGGKVV